MGARVINEVSNIMFEQFTECFRQKLQGVEGEPGAPKPISAVGVAFSALKATLTGGSKPGEPGSTEKEKP
jgi:hypothetical protein